MSNEEHCIFKCLRVVYIARPDCYVIAHRHHSVAEANLARQHNDLFPTFMVVKRKSCTGLECNEV